MNKDIINFLVIYQKWILFFFCVVFGVAAKESYQKITIQGYQITKIGYKFVVSFLVCFPVKEICEYMGWIRWQPYIIMFCSCFYEIIMEWVAKDLLPALQKVAITLITKKNKDGNS